MELVAVLVRVRACVNCGCQYSQELLDDVDEAVWRSLLTSDRYVIDRHEGNPPYVVVEMYTDGRGSR